MFWVGVCDGRVRCSLWACAHVHGVLCSALSCTQDAERRESAKAAAAAGLGGAVAILPLAFSDGSGAGAALLAIGVAGLACALQGVTYRYAVRQDVANTQLKVGRGAGGGRASKQGCGVVHINTWKVLAARGRQYLSMRVASKCVRGRWADTRWVDV